jgi:hypothetical protein
MLVHRSEFRKNVSRTVLVIERNAEEISAFVSVGIIEIPALNVTAVWEKRDGQSHSFKTYGLRSSDTAEELSPDLFHERIATAWVRHVDAYLPKAEQVG